jgi:transcriptional regulator with XRE-family HTH domain
VVWASGTLYGCEFDAAVKSAVLSAAQLRSALAGPTTISAPREMSAETFGERLHRLRKLRGLSMAQIATSLEVSKPTVWAWEQDKARPILSRIDALAQVLQVPSWELLAQRDPDLRHQVLNSSREKIAQVFGIDPDMVRILIEL